MNKSTLTTLLGVAVAGGAAAMDNPFSLTDLPINYSSMAEIGNKLTSGEGSCGAMSERMKINSTPPSRARIAGHFGECPQRNGRIAFSSIRDGNSEIYTVNPDGSDPRRLTTNPGVDTHPAYSEDGRKIAFTSEREGRYDVWIMNADGSEQTRVTTSPGKHNIPSFFPGGQRIAFQSTRGEESPQIYAINIDGTNEVRLSHSAKKDMGPKVSPDGTQILFSSNRAGGGFDLYLMKADGSHIRRLTHGVNNDFSRAWSPNGRKIVFNNNVNGVGQIFTLSLKTRRKHQLTFNPGTTPPFNPGDKYPGFSFGTLQGDITPSWAPDGKHIVFASDRAGFYEIFTVNLKGKQLKQLTFTDSAQISTAWQPVPCPVIITPLGH